MLRIAILPIVVAVLAMPYAAALAQCPPPALACPLAEGEIGIFADPGGTEWCTTLTSFAVATLYVVGRVPAGGVSYFEIPNVQVVASASWVSLNAQFAGNVGFEQYLIADACAAAGRIDDQSCPTTQGDLIVLSIVSGFYSGFAPEVLCFEPFCPELSGNVVQAPTYQRCDNGLTETWTLSQYWCVGNQTPSLAAETHTWGRIKALYR